MRQFGDRGRPLYREMTVANIQEPKSTNHADVVFLESARFYRLSKKHPQYQAILSTLRTAMNKHVKVTVRFASVDSDVIEGIG
jgi:hypothetical protein